MIRLVSGTTRVLSLSQLVSAGGEGFYSAINSGGVGAATAKNPRPDHDPSWFVQQGGQFVGNGALDSIDVLSYHMHPADWGVTPQSKETTADFIPRWMVEHDRDARLLGKPVYLGEFSLDDENLEQRDQLMATVLNAAAKTSNTAGITAWHLTLDNVNCCDRALVPTRAADRVSE